MADYIPRPDPKFNAWIGKAYHYCKNKTTTLSQSVDPDQKTTPAWPHIPESAMDDFTAAWTKWDTAWQIVQGMHTPAETRNKTIARDELEPFVRTFVNQYLRYPPVQAEDRSYMEITERKTTHSRQPIPKDMAETDITNAPKGHIHIMRYWILGSTSKSKRPYHGLEIQTAVRKNGEAPPGLTNDADWDKSEICVDNPLEKVWADDLAGQEAYYRYRWENSNGGKGQWAMSHAPIP
jgi:hypothetical protein